MEEAERKAEEQRHKMAGLQRSVDRLQARLLTLGVAEGRLEVESRDGSAQTEESWHELQRRLAEGQPAGGAAEEASRRRLAEAEAEAEAQRQRLADLKRELTSLRKRSADVGRALRMTRLCGWWLPLSWL